MTSSTLASPEQAASKLAPANRKYGGLSADERSAQRREKLLEAAIEVFGTLGLRKATMRDICNEARIAERYFSEHFSSASDAYEAAFKLISEQAIEVIGTAMARAQMNTPDLARAGLTALFNFVKEDPRRAQIMLIDSSSYWRHVTIRTNPELVKQALVMKRFKDLLYPGLPDTINVEIIGAALLGASLQACLTWAQSGFVLPVSVAVEHLMFVWEGLDRWYRSEIAQAQAADGLPHEDATGDAASDDPAPKRIARKTGGLPASDAVATTAAPKKPRASAKQKA